MYAQQLEGDGWRGGKIDKAKVDKMSGEFWELFWLFQITSRVFLMGILRRSAAWADVRAYAGD